MLVTSFIKKSLIKINNDFTLKNILNKLKIKRKNTNKILTNYLYFLSPLVEKYYLNSWISNTTTVNIFYNLYHVKSKTAQVSKELVKTSNPIYILKFTKKQLFSFIVMNNVIKKFHTNGSFIKPLEFDKNKKKDIKLTILNVKKTVDFLFLKKYNSFSINILGSHNHIPKVLKFLKKNKLYKNSSYLNLFIYTPLMVFSSHNFKKIKSIKRKLRKKYPII